MPEAQLSELIEAKYYLPRGNSAELESFAVRQRRARQRFVRLKGFYEKNPCRMTRLHMLATCAVTLGRFAGFSETFDKMGAYFMPLDEENNLRTAEWQAFADACQQKLPIEVREELWLAAHFKDLQRVRENGLYARFEEESAQNKSEPTWQLLQQHMDVALGVRLMDNYAISGILPYETAIADSLALFVKKLFTASSLLLARYAKETLRAVFSFAPTPKGLFSYRQTAFGLMRYTFTSFTVSKLFRRGLRERERGHVAETEGWNLLEQVLGERIDEINPLITDFYSNPSQFEVVSTLKLETLPAKFWTWVLTLLIGQGLYETDLQEIPTRFRIFKRADGSMHFLRELYCHDKYRVFDSDFVVRENTLYEIFTDLKVAVEMDVQPIENKGLMIQSKNVLWHGRRLPSVGFHVEFKSRVERDETGEFLRIDGELQMKPRTGLGEFFARKVLRRPKNLGSIHYVARLKSS